MTTLKSCRRSLSMVANQASFGSWYKSSLKDSGKYRVTLPSWSGRRILNAASSPSQYWCFCITSFKYIDLHAVRMPSIPHFDYNSTRRFWQMQSPCSNEGADTVRRLNEVYHGILCVTELSLFGCYFYLGSFSIPLVAPLRPAPAAPPPPRVSTQKPYPPRYCPSILHLYLVRISHPVLAQCLDCVPLFYFRRSPVSSLKLSSARPCRPFTCRYLNPR